MIAGDYNYGRKQRYSSQSPKYPVFVHGLELSVQTTPKADQGGSSGQSRDKDSRLPGCIDRGAPTIAERLPVCHAPDLYSRAVATILFDACILLIHAHVPLPFLDFIISCSALIAYELPGSSCNTF